MKINKTKPTAKVEVEKPQEDDIDSRLASLGKSKSKTTLTLPTGIRPAIKDLSGLTILIYGEKKIGKSSMASFFPNAIFFSGEVGTKGFDASVVDINSWEEFKSYTKLLKTQPHDFKTVIVDTIDPIYEYCMDYVAEEEGWDHPSDEGYGKGWKAVKKEFSNGIDALLKTGLGVVFLSHVTESKFMERTGGEYNKLISSMPGQARNFISAQSDVIIYYGYYGNKRMMTIRGSDSVESGHRMRKNFWIKGGMEQFKKATEEFNGRELTEKDEEKIDEISWKYRVHSIPCGADEEQAYNNLVKAFNNEQISNYAPEDDDDAVISDRKAKMESSKKK